MGKQEQPSNCQQHMNLFCNISSLNVKLAPDFADWVKSLSRTDNLHTAQSTMLHRLQHNTINNATQTSTQLDRLHVSLRMIWCNSVQIVKLVWEWSDLRFTWW